MIATGPPGSHPHSDRPNWRPTETPDDYLRNCRECLETFSGRRFAKLMGMSRAHLWRAKLKWGAKLMAKLPPGPFEHLLAVYCGPVLRHPAEPLPAVDLGGRVWLGGRSCKGGPAAPAFGG
jgi:hypothetical protein